MKLAGKAPIRVQPAHNDEGRKAGTERQISSLSATWWTGQGAEWSGTPPRAEDVRHNGGLTAFDVAKLFAKTYNVMGGL